MNDPNSAPPSSPPAHEEAFEASKRALSGYDYDHTLTTRIPVVLRDEVTIDQNEATERQGLLDDNLPGLGIDPTVVPDARSLRRLGQTDWERVATHSTPLLALWSKARLRTVHDKLREKERKLAHLPTRTPREEALDRLSLKALPLVHGTTYDQLKKIMETGQLSSNRAVDDAEKGAGDKGATYLEDRMFGLDRFVFADFGRRHMFREQPEITILVSPKVLSESGTIITEKDIADCLEVSEYLRGLSLPEDFYETALARIRSSWLVDKWSGEGAESDHGQEVRRFIDGADADPQFPNGPQFSTWEVKIPEVPIDQATKFIFKNPEQYQEFVERFGNDQAVLEPKLGRSMEKYNKELWREAMEADYAERLRLLETAADTRDSYIVIDEATLTHDIPVNIYNPDLVSKAAYSSVDLAQRSVDESRNQSSGIMGSFADSRPMLIAHVKQADNGAQVITDYVRCQ